MSQYDNLSIIQHYRIVLKIFIMRGSTAIDDRALVVRFRLIKL